MNRVLAALLGATIAGCAAHQQPSAQPTSTAATPAAAPAARAPFSSTYTVAASPPTLIRGATVLTGTGTRIDDGDVLIVGGRIAAVGSALGAPADARVIDARGRWVTPGLIDVHSHMGAYANPGTESASDGNESTDPVTSNVWVEHSIWPQDPGFEAALQGGVTSLQVLPGSANLIGGRGVTIKSVPATTYRR
jgi:imidazolonepropionase-like amidohydrolase